MNEAIYQKLKTQIEKNLEVNPTTTFRDALAGVKPNADKEHLTGQYSGEISRECLGRLEAEYTITINPEHRALNNEVRDCEISPRP